MMHTVKKRLRYFCFVWSKLTYCIFCYNLLLVINIGKGDQFTSGFVKVNPNSKIPACVDKDGPNGKFFVLCIVNFIETTRSYTAFFQRVRLQAKLSTCLSRRPLFSTLRRSTASSFLRIPRSVRSASTGCTGRWVASALSAGSSDTSSSTHLLTS